MLPPNLFLIGAPKAGTSALAYELSQHRDVFCEEKEPRFFDSSVFYDDPALYPIRTIQEYLELYANPRAQKKLYRMDASVFVMYSRAALASILELSPNAKFILVLRDPLAATKSMFNQRLKYVDPKMREISDNFCECWQALDRRKSGHGYPSGCKNRILFRYDLLYHYEWSVPAVQEEVGHDSLMIVDYEDLVHTPRVVLDNVYAFLGLAYQEPVTVGSTVNPTYVQPCSAWNRALYQLERMSLRFARGMGVGRSGRTRLKRYVDSVRVTRLPQNDGCDREVMEEFTETYSFMNAIGLAASSSVPYVKRRRGSRSRHDK